MSRGPGAVQRAVLERLTADRWVSARTLAEELAGGPASRAQVEAVRRAVHALERRGLAETTTATERRPAGVRPALLVRAVRGGDGS
jgi:predicted ArsR family transcriptional regulator